MKTRVRVGFAVAIILTAMGFLMASSLQSSSTYYFTVAEVHGQAKQLTGRHLRVAGEVQVGSIDYNPEAFHLDFSITDGQRSIPVAYKGVRPNNFTDQAPVIVEGKLEKGGLFRVDRLLVQCPSKYETELPDVSPQQSRTGEI